MKTTIGKLAIFSVVVALGIFMVVASVSAGQHIPIAIRGQYAATSEGTCMVAPFGFNPNLTPINGLGIISIANRVGVFTFEKDGTGSATQDGSVITLSYIGPSGQVPPSAASQTLSWDFTYTATDDGMITITQVPGTSSVEFTSGPSMGLTYEVEGTSLKGTITPDGKNINLNGSASNLLTLSGPNLPPIGSNHSCSSSWLLIWQK